MRRVDERLAWAEATLTECRRIALTYAARGVRVYWKPDATPVTAADRAIEGHLRRKLARAFPGDAVVGEELGINPEASQTGSYWTIDPIDGTRAFTRGLPSWGILLGRVERGVAVLGACAYPVFELFLGVAPGTRPYERHRGTRTWLRPAQSPPSLERAVVFHGGTQWWCSTRYAEGFRRVVRRCYLERAYGDCFAYLWVLRGRADVMLDYGVKVWDLAPFAALGAATGRVLTDFAGRPSFTGPEAVFSHPRLARTIVRALKGKLSHRATGPPGHSS